MPVSFCLSTTNNGDVAEGATLSLRTGGNSAQSDVGSGALRSSVEHRVKLRSSILAGFVSFNSLLGVLVTREAQMAL
jgi:hypothetical protein